MKSAGSMKLKLASLGLSALLGTIAWAVGYNVVSAAPAAPANLKTFMISTVGPSTQSVWDKSYADKLADQDWANVRKAATDLTTAVSMVSAGGTGSRGTSTRQDAGVARLDQEDVGRGKCRKGGRGQERSTGIGDGGR
jgi:hypothetical protein